MLYDNSMNYVLLSGNSIHNKLWVQELKQSIAAGSDNVYIHNYKHWDINEDFIDFDYELNSLINNIKDFPPFIVLAKSVGVVLALNLLKLNVNKPVACLFMGLPITLTNELGVTLNESFNDIDIPVIIAQNDKDPFGSFSDVSRLIKHTNNINIETYKFRGNTHSYINFDEINKLVLKFSA